MASGEPPPMHHRSFVQTVFDYSLWAHIGWSGLANVLNRNGLVGRITRQRCTSPRHSWMPSKGRKQTQALSSVFLREPGEALAQQLPRWKLSLPGHEESYVLQRSWEHGENCSCCSLVAPGCDFWWLDAVRLRAGTQLPSCTQGSLTYNISTSKMLQPGFVSVFWGQLTVYYLNGKSSSQVMWWEEHTSHFYIPLILCFSDGFAKYFPTMFPYFA